MAVAVVVDSEDLLNSFDVVLKANCLNKIKVYHEPLSFWLESRSIPSQLMISTVCFTDSEN